MITYDRAQLPPISIGVAYYYLRTDSGPLYKVRYQKLMDIYGIISSPDMNYSTVTGVST